MRTVREFDSPKSCMWDAFAGCERWPDQSCPVWVDVGKYLVIADGQGVSCYTEDDFNISWWLMRNLHEIGAFSGFATQLAAKAFLAGLPDDFEPTAYGFARV